jgi:hypothetical protein
MDIYRNIEGSLRIMLPWESNRYYIFVCVGARGLMCPRARGRMHARARVSLLIQHAIYMPHIVTSFVVPLAAPNFSTLSHKGRIFEIKNSLNIKRTFLPP